MPVNAQSLKAKLREMYPEISKHQLDLTLNFNKDKDAWLVHLKRGAHELTTYLEDKDAQDCLGGVKCVYLGVQIGQFIKNFEAA